MDCGLDREADAQQPGQRLAPRHDDLHRHALDDLGKVPRRVAGGDGGERRAGGRRQTLHNAIKVNIVGIHMDAYVLTGQDVTQCDLPVVGFDINLVERHNRHQRRSGRDVISGLDCPVADHAIDRRHDRRVAQVELGLRHPGLVRPDGGRCCRALRLEHGNLASLRLEC